MNRATAILFWFTLTIVVSVGLYDTSYRVQDLRGQLRTINAKIEAEQRNLHVLKAEWGYLTNPARIEMAARKHLKLSPTATTQIARLDDLREILPVRNDALMGSGSAAGSGSGSGLSGTQLASAGKAEISKVSIVTKAKIAQPQASAVKVALEDEHLNTHVVIRRTANAETATRRINLDTNLGASLGFIERGATP